MPLPTVPDIDDRITCAECLNGMRPGPCQAAKLGQLPASRTYDPDRQVLRRCEAYQPGPKDQDRRIGRARWPWLVGGKR